MACRSEQAKRIPTSAPCVADPFAGIQNDELHSALRQVVSDGETCLSAADDDRIDTLCRVHICHRPSPLLTITLRRVASGAHRAEYPDERGRGVGNSLHACSPW